MYFQNGIVYGGETRPILKAVLVRPMENYCLLVRFTTGESKTFDFTPLLEKPVFSRLKDTGVFNAVYLEYGVPTWCDGMIDIAPEWLYEDGITVEKTGA